MFIELCFNFMYVLRIYPSCGQLLFSCLTSSLSCEILSQVGLLEVPATYMGFHGYFLARGPVLLNGCSSKKLMLMLGPECAAYLTWSRTLSVYTFWVLVLLRTQRDQPQQATKMDNNFIYTQVTKGSGRHKSWNGSPRHLLASVGTVQP
jgi:hypothetical protein